MSQPPISKRSESTNDILQIYVKPVHIYWISSLLVVMMFTIMNWNQYIQVKEIPQSTHGIAHQGMRSNTYVSRIYAPNLLEEDPSVSGLLYSEELSPSYDTSAATSSLSTTCVNQVLDFVNGQSLAPSSGIIQTSLAPAHSSRPIDDRGLALHHFLKTFARSIISFPRNFLQSLANFVRFFVG